ncbi:DUF3152 domain-containing protein [Streptomyces sp. enrichment culture]|uniref:DUF3152 domain-containing protein n=1 Tax=Streptomyces sp. enrichment culture TaxID=1795815 RepID=UPI003F577FEE
MGRHSRRGPAPRADAADPATAREDRSGAPGRRGAAGPTEGQRTSPTGPRPPGNAPRPAPGGPWIGPQDGPQGRPQSGPARGPQGGGAQGGPQAGPGFVGPGLAGPGFAGPRSAGPESPGPGRGPGQRFTDGTPAHGFPAVPGEAQARGFSGAPEGTPARGTPQAAWDGTPAHGVRGFAEGTPAHGVPGLADGTPARGVSRFADGTPAHGVPRVRGGHPEQRETGGGWGELDGRPTAPGQPARPGPPLPRQRQGPPQGPRQEYLDAFAGDDDVFAARPPYRTDARAQPADPYSSVTDWSADDDGGTTLATAADDGGDDAPPTGEPVSAKGGKGRAFTGVAAAAVTTVLAIVVAGQVADGSDGSGTRSQSAAGQARDTRDSASRTDGLPTPSPSVAPLTYEQKMGKKYPLGADLRGSGRFDAIPGIAKAPGTGQKYTYRVDVEQGLDLDGELFAEAVQKTLNDQRSWAHNGARTFERIHSGRPDFVITLASPGTTADWCAKSGLDTTEDNVSCDSAATERVMINAYRWAQGAKPYGDAILPYRQMLINHEVGHRLGHNHVTCDKDGELAPVMQQQTKFIDHDGIDCRPNPWAYPNG